MFQGMMKGSGGLVELRGYEGFGLVHGVYALKILGLGFVGSERQTSQFPNHKPATTAQGARSV